MAFMSKHEVDKRLLSVACKDLLHPWTDSCFSGIFTYALACATGSMKYFLIMYAAQILSKKKSGVKIDIKGELLSFLRSMAHASLFGGVFVATICIYRKLFGRIDYNVISYYAPLFSGVPIFIETLGRINVTATTFTTMALEGFYRSKITQGVLKKSVIRETIAFMVINAFLMYSIRAKRKYKSHWFFTPPKLEKSSNINSSVELCSHRGTCIENLVEEVSKFSMIGMAFSAVRFLIIHYKTPTEMSNNFLRWKNFKLATFIGTYVGLFKILSCYLCKKRGDSLVNTFYAGLLSGLSYGISPNYMLLFSELFALIEIAGSEIKDKCSLPNLPYYQISHIISNMYLIQLCSQELERKSCPSFFLNTVKIASANTVTIIIDNFYKIMTS